MGDKDIIDAVRGGYYAGDWPMAVRLLCKRIAALEAALHLAHQRFAEMPNPHADPMRHYYNQSKVWLDEIEAALSGEVK